MKANNLNLYMNILKIGLVAIGAILCFLIISGPNAEATVTVQEEFREGTKMGLTTGYAGFVIFAGIGLILLFFVIQLITNPGETVMSIIGILIALVVFLILWAIGSSDTNASLALKEDVQVEQSTISATTAGLFTVIFGLIVAAGLVIWDFVKSLGKAV